MNNQKKILKYIGLAVLILVIISFVYKQQHNIAHYIAHFNIHNMRRYILSYGEFAALIFVVIYSLKPVVLIIPTALMSILAATIFKPYYALLLSMIGCFGSGTLAFFLSRSLGKSFVDKVLKGKAMTLDKGMEKHGFKIILLMRLAVIFPYDPLSYAAGLTKMRYRDFILGTLLGIFPEMISYSLIGKGLRHPFSFKIFIPIIIIIIIATGALFMYKYSKNTNNS